MKKTTNDDSYSHILKYTGIFGGVQGLNILIGVMRNKLVALILGPEGMGLIALFSSTIKLMSDSTNLGLGMSAVREMSEAYEEGNEAKVAHIVKLIRAWSLVTAIVGTLLCVILSPWLNRWTFTWGDHTLHFVFLSPMVGLMAITSGEMAILKGTRRLKRLAELSLYGVAGSLLISIPLYVYWHEAAIVPSLVFVAALQMLLAVSCSYRLYPLRLSFGTTLLGEGMGMVRLGVAFVLAGILGSGVEFVIRSFLNTAGSLDVVGLYNAGYLMTVTYAGMVFQAMETDYYPRLSSVSGVGAELNGVVNRQIEVSLLLVAPLLVAFMVAAPILLPLLYSAKFLPIMGMMKLAILSMYVRAVVVPIEYIALSRGDSWSYLFQETVYDVLVVVFVVVGYRLLGLDGTGWALVLAGVCNMLVALVFTRWRYGYRLSLSVRAYALLQVPLGVLAYAVSLVCQGWTYWLGGSLLALLSLAMSVYILHTKSHLWNSLVSKIKSRTHHG